MAAIIRIKRSATAGNPSVLAAGELAYSALSNNDTNGGDRLYIGIGTETAGDAANHIVVGGKYFTDLLDHNRGTLTASSALITDSNSKLDNLKVDNLDLNGNTISSTDTNGNIVLSPNGTGKLVLNNVYINGTSDTLAEYIYDTVGGTITAGNGIDITNSDPGNTSTVSLNTEYAQDLVGSMFSGGTHSGLAVTYDDDGGYINLNVNDPTITIAGDVDGSATMTNLGNTTITVTLDTVNSNVGSYGSTTKIPTFTVNGKGLLTAAGEVDVATSLSIAGDTGTDTVSLLSDTLTIAGGEGIDVAVTNNTITVSGELATSSNKGVASFDSGDFDVTSGAVTIKTGGVSNTQLENSSVTVGSTSISLGATSTSLAGLTELTVDNLNFNGNEIQSTNSNGDIVLNPNGTGAVDVSGAKITNLAEPVLGTDAATKNYVDSAVTGLNWKDAVNLLADSNVALTGVSGTLVIDGHDALDPTDSGLYRILLTGQTTPANNGIYTYTDNGSTYTLSRSDDADVYTELISASVWVLEGTVYASTGWTQTNHYLTNFGGGSQFQSWVQFSGAGAYTAGAGLGQSGTSFFVNVATSGGIEIVSDELQLKSTLAGNGLTYSTGVLSVGGTSNRITINSDSIDIASTYVGQSSITTLGTITTGTWNGSVIADTYIADDLTISGGTINNTPIGSSTRSSGAFTTLAANGLVTLTNTTDASALGTAAVVLSGGLSVAKTIYVGNNITGAGASTSTLDGFNIDGGTY